MDFTAIKNAVKDFFDFVSQIVAYFNEFIAQFTA